MERSAPPPQQLKRTVRRLPHAALFAKGAGLRQQDLLSSLLLLSLGSALVLFGAVRTDFLRTLLPHGLGLEPDPVNEPNRDIQSVWLGAGAFTLITVVTTTAWAVVSWVSFLRATLEERKLELAQNRGVLDGELARDSAVAKAAAAGAAAGVREAVAQRDAARVVVSAAPLQSVPEQPGVAVTGVAMGLPTTSGDAFGEQAVADVMAGKQLLQPVSPRSYAQLRRAVPAGVDAERRGALAAILPPLDAVAEGVPAKAAKCLDTAALWGVVAGLRALKNAGLLDEALTLPEEMRGDTGVVLSSAFPQLQHAVSYAGERSADADSEFPRKAMISLLCSANTQLAAIVKARGPNLHMSAACAGTSAALALAHDWIRLGRCKRVVVIAADDSTNETMFPWVAPGFARLGVLSPRRNAADIAAFSSDRGGFVLGAGACGMVLERDGGASGGGIGRSLPAALQGPMPRLIHTALCNAGASTLGLDGEQMASTFANVASEVGLSDPSQVVYIGHETGTQACAELELAALRRVFGAEGLCGEDGVLITGVKPLLGHAMGAGFEDALAVVCLRQRCVPPVVNLSEPVEGAKGVNFAVPKPGQSTVPLSDRRRFVVHFSAGFGGHCAYSVFSN